MIIDTHAHFDDDKFDGDREEVLESMQEAGIGIIVNIGASMKSSRTTLALARKYDFVYAAVGVHPESIHEMGENPLEELEQMAADKKVVMIGEIGLDYYWDNEHKQEQAEIFKSQLELAVKLDLPVCIHSRDAAEDTYRILKEAVDNAKKAGKRLYGVVHCFSYSYEMAVQFLELGFVLGIGGVVTFKNSKKLKEVVEKVPLEKLVLETDAPYLAPEPNRGKRNSSLYLPYVVAEIARLKGITEEEVIEVTEKNARLLLGI